MPCRGGGVRGCHSARLIVAFQPQGREIGQGVGVSTLAGLRGYRKSVARLRVYGAVKGLVHYLGLG